MNATIRVFQCRRSCSCSRRDCDDHQLPAGMIMVAQASNGREAIERFREHKPDCPLMDLRLPDMSGIDAMIAIRTEFPGARIIILTTFESNTEIQRALAEGACAYMLKSTHPTDLAETIRRVHSQ